MCNESKVMDINNEVFSTMRRDLNKILTGTLKNMTSKGSDEATITVKITLTLDHEDVYNSESECDDDTRDAIKPSVVHKISSVLTIKDEQKGICTGDEELVWDKDLGTYVTRPFSHAQTSMYDQPEAKESSTSAEDDATIPNQAQIPGKAPAKLLSGPDDTGDKNGDAIDADFHEIDNDVLEVENCGKDILVKGFQSVEQAEKFADDIIELNDGLEVVVEVYDDDSGADVRIKGANKNQKNGIKVICENGGLSIVDCDPNDGFDMEYDAPAEE